MKLSGGGGIAGFIFDNIMSTFPVGTLIGTFAKNFVNFDAGDMDRAYDSKAASASSSFDFGDLKGMGERLFGKAEEVVRSFTEGMSEDTQKSAQSGRPRTDQAALGEAQTKVGFGSMGKALLIGGAVIAGIALLSNIGTMGMMGMGMGMGGMWGGYPMYGMFM